MDEWVDDAPVGRDSRSRPRYYSFRLEERQVRSYRGSLPAKASGNQTAWPQRTHLPQLADREEAVVTPLTEESYIDYCSGTTANSSASAPAALRYEASGYLEKPR